MDTQPPKAMIRPRLLRYFVCLELQAAKEPLDIRDLVARFERSPYAIRGRTSKAISDTIRWAVPRGWIYPMGRGKVRPGRIPESTARYMRRTLEVAAASGGDLSLRTTEARRALSVERADNDDPNLSLWRCGANERVLDLVRAPGA